MPLALEQFMTTPNRHYQPQKKALLGLLACLVFLTAFAYPAKKLIIEPNQSTYPFVSAINHAKHNIDLVMYGFTDRTLRSALLRAKTRGVQVRIILEKHPYLSEDENHHADNIFKAHHISVHPGNHLVDLTHQKTLIIDNKSAWIMTLNFTYSAFTKQRNFAVLVTSPEDIHEIESLFNADWQQEKPSLNKPPRLIWSPINARQTITQLIQNAKSSLKVYALNLSDYQTIGNLANAAKRGVAVSVILSTQSLKNAAGRLRYLKKRHVKIYRVSHPQIHAKMLLADIHMPDEKAYLGSANLTKESLDNNRELGLIIKNPKILSRLNTTFNTDK